MRNRNIAAPGLTLRLKERAYETVVRCTGKIAGKSADTLEEEILDRLIPESRGKGAACNCRIVLDIAEVTFIDSRGLGALFSVWSAAQKKSCEIEIANRRPQSQSFLNMMKIDRVISRIRTRFGSVGA